MPVSPEYPRISARSPRDHDKITARLPHHPFRTGAVRHVAISDHRYGNRLFYLADDAPVRLPGIVLFPYPAMYGDGTCAGLLGSFCQFDSRALPRHEACPHFYGDRPVGNLHAAADDRFRQLRITHQRTALPVLYDLRHGAAHIDVEYIVGIFLHVINRNRKCLRIRTEQLHRYGVLLLPDVDQFVCLPVSVLDGVGADHLGRYHRGAHFPAEQTERMVRDSGHGPEDQRIFQSDIPAEVPSSLSMSRRPRSSMPRHFPE